MMLAAEQRELVAAAVDGELSATEARDFRLLLAASPEARELFARLMSDSERVRALPRVEASPPADLRATIMARVAATTPAPGKLPKAAPAPCPQPAAAPPRRRALPSWVPVAVAASLLVCITAGSFAFFTAQPGSRSPVAKHPWSHVLPAPQDGPGSVPSPTQPAPRALPQPDPDAVAHSDVSPVPPLPLPKEVVRPAVAVAPEPRPAQHDFFASPLLPKLPPFDLIQARVPFLHGVAELEREDVLGELRDELTRDATVRLDLFVRDTARGADVFQSAAKAAGLTMFADAGTLDRLKKRQAHSVVIYIESLTADELSALFGKVAAADAKFSPRVCGSLHALPVTRSDEAELKAILGLDVGLYKRQSATGAGSPGQGGDPKPLSAGTIDTVTKALTNPVNPGEKAALLMTWQTTHPGIARTAPLASAELKQFLAKRGERKPNAVPAIIVIRPVG